MNLLRIKRIIKIERNAFKLKKIQKKKNILKATKIFRFYKVTN